MFWSHMMKFSLFLGIFGGSFGVGIYAAYAVQLDSALGDAGVEMVDALHEKMQDSNAIIDSILKADPESSVTFDNLETKHQLLIRDLAKVALHGNVTQKYKFMERLHRDYLPREALTMVNGLYKDDEEFHQYVTKDPVFREISERKTRKRNDNIISLDLQHRSTAPVAYSDLEDSRRFADGKPTSIIPEGYNEHPYSGGYEDLIEGNDSDFIRNNSGQYPPVLVSHGISDSCYTPFSKDILKTVSIGLDTYATCISTGGDSHMLQYVASFFLDFDASVDEFRDKIRADEQLVSGFIALGFSQGNGILRGYIQKYNDPPVLNWLAFHGILTGEGAVPGLDPTSILWGSVYQPISTLAATLCAHQTFVKFVTPCGYFRHPEKVKDSTWRNNSYIAQWNGEGTQNGWSPAEVKQKSKFLKTKRFVFIKALEDQVIYPREEEWWGFYGDNYSLIIDMGHLPWYTKNLFGLKTAVSENRVFFDTTCSGHMAVTPQELIEKLKRYVIVDGDPKSDVIVVGNEQGDVTVGDNEKEKGLKAKKDEMVWI